MMVGPIILTAGNQQGGKGDSGDKRLSKPNYIKKSPLKDGRQGDIKTTKKLNQP